jgi:hypothetical protein
MLFLAAAFDEGFASFEAALRHSGKCATGLILIGALGQSGVDLTKCLTLNTPKSVTC